MQLSFYAREGLLPLRDQDGHSLPRPAKGSPMRYVGRKFQPPRLYPAIKEPVKCETGTGLATYLAKHCAKGALWPADKVTAAVCGVPFVEVVFKDGIWVPREQAGPKAKESSS